MSYPQLRLRPFVIRKQNIKLILPEDLEISLVKLGLYQGLIIQSKNIES